jgi:hypothetical protein
VNWGRGKANVGGRVATALLDSRGLERACLRRLGGNHGSIERRVMTLVDLRENDGDT